MNIKMVVMKFMGWMEMNIKGIGCKSNRKSTKVAMIKCEARNQNQC